MTQHPPIHKTVGELAALTGGKLEGDPNTMIEGASGLREATPTDVSFLGNPKYAAAAASSKAGCLFLPLAGSAEARCDSPNKIFVEDPQFAFSLVLALIEAARPKKPPVIDPKSAMHYQTVLGPGVSVGPFTVAEHGVAIGEGTVVGPNCYFGEGVKIGRFCKIYAGVVIREHCVIGDHVVLHAGAVIGADGFGFSTDRKTGKHRKIPQIGNVVIRDYVEVGANSTIDRATVGSTFIDAGTKIDNLVQIGHNCQIGKDCLLVSQAGVAGSCELGDRVILAGQAGLAGHLKLGDGAIIMAKTGVMADVEKGQMLFGYPSRPHREAFKLQVLYGRLPEMYEALKQIKEKLGLGDKAKA